MASLNIKLDFLVVETSINTFLCKFYYYDNVNSAIKPWTAQQSTKQDALALMQTYSNDLYIALQNKEGITPLGGGSVTDYGVYSEMSFDIVVETGSQTQDIDYTQILTSINSNLASIASKNNQSDIVQVIKDCFIENIDNAEQSVFKTGSSNNTIKAYGIIPTLLMRIAAHFSSNSSYTWNSSINNSNKCLDEISKKLSFSVPQADTSGGSLRGVLLLIKNALLGSTSNNLEQVASLSLFKQISDKLANSNDLHTISQAIDLISTAIAQTPTTDTSNLEQGLNDIKAAVENKDNLLLIDGTQNFEFRKRGDEYDA